MAEKVTNELIYEGLKSLQKGQEEIKQKISDLKFHIGSIERSIDGMKDTLVHETMLSNRISSRLDRINTRLELTDS